VQFYILNERCQAIANLPYPQGAQSGHGGLGRQFESEDFIPGYEVPPGSNLDRDLQ